MQKKSLKLMALILAAFMLASAFTACRKEGEEKPQVSSSGTKSTTSVSAKTSPKSSSATSTNTGNSTKSISTNDITNNVTSDTSTNTVSENYTDAEGKTDNENIQENEGESIDNSSDLGENLVSENKTFDLKGREIKIMITADNEEYMLPKPDWGTKTGDVRYKLMKEAEEKFNCKFVFEIYSNMTNLKTQVQNSLMAGVYFCDVFRLLLSYVLPSMELNNMLLPLNDYIDFSRPIFQKYDQVRGLVNRDKIYALFSKPYTPVGIWYNKAVTEREGIDIHDLANSGNWTWETFISAAVSMTHDLNGDGIIDQWGLGAPNAQFMAQAMLASNQAVVVDWSDARNSFAYNLQSPSALLALQFTSDLYNTYKVLANKNAESDFRAGNVAMFVREGWYGMNWKQYGMENLGFEDFPVGPNSDGTAFVREQSVAHHFFYPSSLEDPDAVVNAVAYWDIIWDDTRADYVTKEEMLMSTAQTYMYSDQDVNTYLKIMNKKLKYDYAGYFPNVNTIITREVYNKIATVQTTAASAVDTIKDEIQSIIDATMGR